MNGATTQTLRRRRGQSDYSYKFQRLREKIRQSVASGELSGKLPGERELARRFGVNAKTLSKALTDLAAEGLLSRSIGRGTFVKGAETETSAQGPWLLVCDESTESSPLLAVLRRINPELETVHDVTAPRPSFINKFAAVIDLSPRTPAAFVRDMLVRNLPLVVVGREPGTYATNAVLVDREYLAARLGREFLLAGHRRMAVIESQAPADGGALTKSLRSSTCRYAPDATLSAGGAADAVSLVEQGVTALLCGSTSVAAEVRARLSEAGISVPNVVSVAAVGEADGDYPCSGFFVGAEQTAEAVVHLLQNAKSGGNGAILWLTGKQIDLGSTGPATASAEAGPPKLSLTA